MFNKKIISFSEQQMQWLKSVDRSGVTHAQFAERMSDEERSRFLKESEFIESASSEAIHKSGMFDIIDFVEIVRGDIIYLDTFKNELANRTKEKDKKIFTPSGYYAKSLVIFYLFMFAALFIFTFSLKASIIFLSAGSIYYILAVLFIPAYK